MQNEMSRLKLFGVCSLLSALWSQNENRHAKDGLESFSITKMAALELQDLPPGHTGVAVLYDDGGASREAFDGKHEQEESI